MTAPERPLVLLAVRDRGLRASLRRALEPTLACVEADGPAAAPEAARRETPDVCLLEFDHAGSGLRVTEIIRRAHPDLRVVLLARTLNEPEFLRAVRAGAWGYLPEDVDRERLPHVVAAVLRGEPAVPRVLVRRLLDELRSLGRRSLEVRDRGVVTLTRREAEVLDLVREGAPTHVIARRLGISDVTVRRHRSSLLAKLDAGSSAELVALLEELRVVDAPAPADRPPP